MASSAVLLSTGKAVAEYVNIRVPKACQEDVHWHQNHSVRDMVNYHILPRTAGEGVGRFGAFLSILFELKRRMLMFGIQSKQLRICPENQPACAPGSGRAHFTFLE